CLFIEYDDVGGKAGPQKPPVPEAEGLGRQRSHFADRFLKAYHFLLTNVNRKRARIVAETSRVRDAWAARIDDAAVGCDHSVRFPEYSLHVPVRHLVKHHLRPARKQYINGLLRFFFNAGLMADRHRYFRDALAVEGRVGPAISDVSERKVFEP